MRIHRSSPEANFLILPNETAQDERLSWSARGLLIELLSRPQDWETNADALWQRAKNTRGEKVGEGRRGVRGAFAELEQLGYVTRTRSRVERGRFVTTIDVYDTPGHHRGTADGTSVKSVSVKAASVSGTSLQSTDIQRTELQRTDDKHSSGLAIARSGALASAADEAKSPWDLVDEQRRAEAERERLINGTITAKRPPRGMDAIDTSDVDEGNQALAAHYQAVGRLSDEQLRNALLAFEAKRPLIYRACRNHTFKNLNGEDRGILKGQTGGREADMLAYKYALLHYYNTAAEMPAWLIKPLLANDGKAA